MEQELKYFIRTIGDSHNDFRNAVSRALSKSDYQEVAVSNNSKCIFDIFSHQLSVSVVYSGPHDRHFKSDQFSNISGGRRYIQQDEISLIVRSAFEQTAQHDEVWFNLSKVKILTIAIHCVSLSPYKLMEDIGFVLREAHSIDLPVHIFKLVKRNVGGELAKRDIDKLITRGI